jgi:hypothetical protein
VDFSFGRRGKFALSNFSRILPRGFLIWPIRRIPFRLNEHGHIEGMEGNYSRILPRRFLIWPFRRILFHLNEQWMLDQFYTYSHYFNKSCISIYLPIGQINGYSLCMSKFVIITFILACTQLYWATAPYKIKEWRWRQLHTLFCLYTATQIPPSRS